MKTLWAMVPALMIGATAGAAEIRTETTQDGHKIRWSVTRISPDDIMRVEEGGFGSSVSMSAEGSAGGTATMNYIKGDANDVTIYNPHSKEIMSVEGKVCRVLSADSAPPPGMDFMGGAEMQEHQRQMAEAMKGANAQIAQAMAQAKQGGASQAELDALNRATAMLGLTEGPEQTDDALEIISLDRKETVGEYTTDVYLARTVAGVDKYRLYMVDIDEVDGGGKVKRGMVGMVGLYGEYMEGINAGALMDESLTTVLTSEQFEDWYPAAFEDLERNTRTAIVHASAAESTANFDPDCEKKDMMSY